ncbi:hypothetical protein RJ639_035538 [Escallonia herrerae]|uniref:PROP1-like PPR domain-containing protein n=1 Tax=Escallonia herrerae TaxID=1293975 RepID=A0AA88WXE8_9ASTE|nr:hypothetical protein RJ639_035538 [Escallonia herrerae]
MACLKFSISLDTHDSKKLNFIVNSSQLTLAGYVHATGVCIVNPISKLKHIRVSSLDTQSPELSEPNHADIPKSVDERLVLTNPDGEFRKGRRNIWRRFLGAKKLSKDGKLEPNSGSNGNKNEKEAKPMFVPEGEGIGSGSDRGNALDFDLGGFRSDLSLARCNLILERLEKGRDDEALRFFEWMRNNGKLKKNVTAYKLALRVMGRRQDWDGAERIIDEMSNYSGCEVSFQVFNTLIYACHKRGLVKLGAKWFHMMLDTGVRPNVATFGMLMSLYQKGCAVEEAEFTFSKMRSLKVTCQTAYSAMITIYTRSGFHNKAEQIIDFLTEDEVNLNLENWLVLLNAYSQQGKLDEAERILVSMHEAGFSPHVVAYNTLITGYGKASKMDAAQRLFWNLNDVGLEPDETTYRSMIEGWGRVDNYKEAGWFYKSLKNAGFKPNSANFYTMINLQAKHGDEEGVITTLSDMLSMKCQYSSVLGILLQAYERVGRINRVPSVLKDSFYRHVLVNQTSCSILVMAYVKHCLVDDAIKVLQDKQWKDSVFEDNLYHLLICSCKELGYLDNAVKIYTCMPKPDKPNLHITCTMIEIYSVMGWFAEAEKLYFNLKSSDISLDMIAFSIIVRMYVLSGSLKDACSVLDVMDNQKNITPDIYLLRDMLRIYQRLGMLDKLAELYYKILKNGVPWDQEMYNCVINCCARALPVDELSRLFDEMLRCGFAPNTITFNVMLDVYGKAGLFKKARRLFWMARKRGLVDVVSYNTIIAAYGKSKDFKNMSSAVRKMEFNGLSVSLIAYNCMLDAYGKDGQMEKFKKVLQRMKESGCASDHYTYNIVFNVYGEQGWIEEVAEVLKDLKEYGPGLDLCSYNTLIKAYGIAGMIEDAVALVKEMREHEIEPDRVTYINLISALQKNDKVLEAVKWSLWMKQIGI